MKVIILAGGFGTRLSEETNDRPKPMIEIGGKPILWHIMKIYSSYGMNDFIICCGYKGYMIKEYFLNYFIHTSDITISLVDNLIDVHQRNTEPWKVTLIDTGEKTMTGGRLLQVKDYLKTEESFCFTYGDGLSDININELVAFHEKMKTIATVTAIIPPGRFGSLEISDERVIGFAEKGYLKEEYPRIIKPHDDGDRINGGFFVFTPKVFDYIKDDQTVLEYEPLMKLASIGELSAYNYNGFWQCMDTLRDKRLLDEYWANSEAPWKTW